MSSVELLESEINVIEWFFQKECMGWFHLMLELSDACVSVGYVLDLDELQNKKRDVI